jgi:hypothetical protein
MLAANDSRDAFDGINAILERDYRGLCTHDWANRLHGDFGIPKLDRDNHKICRLRPVHVLDRTHFAQKQWSNAALDAQPGSAHRRQVLSARDERNDVTRRRQSGAEITAEAAGAHHHDIH